MEVPVLAQSQNLVTLHRWRFTPFCLIAAPLKSETYRVAASAKRPAIHYARDRPTVGDHAGSLSLDHKQMVHVKQQAHVNPKTGFIEVHNLGPDIGTRSRHVFQHYPHGPRDMYRFTPRFSSSFQWLWHRNSSQIDSSDY
jgi:hypothetical protein